MMSPATFPVGHHRLRPDTSMNFQMNRWFGWVGEPAMLEEMWLAAPRIATYADLDGSFWRLPKFASQQGRVLTAGFYWRSAEFFVRPDDPDRRSARERFLTAVRSVYGLGQGKRHAVPYSDGHLRGPPPALRHEGGARIRPS
jgi:hypothetical protein